MGRVGCAPGGRGGWRISRGLHSPPFSYPHHVLRLPLTFTPRLGARFFTRGPVASLSLPRVSCRWAGDRDTHARAHTHTPRTRSLSLVPVKGTRSPRARVRDLDRKDSRAIPSVLVGGSGQQADRVPKTDSRRRSGRTMVASVR